jgi:acetyl-CoA carboxylase biotin carboxylase subunit
VTGIDIVKEQIRIAAGLALSQTQDEIQLTGWAMECRVNAEDPFRSFIPSTGKIEQSLIPAGPGIRVDTGVYSGFEISPYYDALISKLIVHENSREETISRMKRALSEYRVIGIHTNIPFHQSLLEDTNFLEGNFDTQYLTNEKLTELVEGGENENELAGIAALAAVLASHKQTQQSAVLIQRGNSSWKWSGRQAQTKD